MVLLEDLVSRDHNYRKFLEIWNLKPERERLEMLKEVGLHEGYGIDRLFLCLLVQFMEDVSYRELEKYLKENTAAKWFCGFSLMGKTPDYSLFSKVRRRIGTKVLSEIFAELRNQPKKDGLQKYQIMK